MLTERAPQQAPQHAQAPLAAGSPLPWIELRITERVGQRLVPPGPALSAQQRHEAVASLREAAALTPPIAAETAGFSGLDWTRGGPDRVIDRRSWVSLNASSVRAMLTAWGVPEQPPSLAAQVRGRAIGVQLGAVLAVLGRRVLGQYDPFGPTPGLVLVAPTIVEVGEQLGLVSTDFHRWVCLHEQTHRLQFAAAPWLPGHLLRLVHTAVSLDDSNLPELVLRAVRRQQREFSNGGLLDLVTSPQAAAALDQVTATMSLLEGHADVMMDRAGPEVIPSLTEIRSRFEQRRDARGVNALVGTLLGMDAKLAQYRDGAAFCREVIAAVGVAGLNRVWTHPDCLPRRDELANPTRWLERMA